MIHWPHIVLDNELQKRLIHQPFMAIIVSRCLVPPQLKDHWLNSRASFFMATWGPDTASVIIYPEGGPSYRKSQHLLSKPNPRYIPRR